MSQIFNHFFSFSKLLVVVLGPVSVGELVSVEDARHTVIRRATSCRTRLVYRASLLKLSNA